MLVCIWIIHHIFQRPDKMPQMQTSTRWTMSHFLNFDRLEAQKQLLQKQSIYYLPDPSFGTHFFQDLVEASIRYLPLYPDDQGVVFNEQFMRSAPNKFSELVPEYAYLEDTVRVIDIPEATGGSLLNVYMNAEIKQAVALFSD